MVLDSAWVDRGACIDRGAVACQDDGHDADAVGDEKHDAHDAAPSEGKADEKEERLKKMEQEAGAEFLQRRVSREQRVPFHQ